jgi:fused signal recognition particle receptor
VGQNDANTERGFLRRLRSGLAKTRTQLAAGVGNLLLGKKEIDDAMLEALETSLLLADVGVPATTRIMEALTRRVKRKQLNDSAALYDALRTELVELLLPISRPFAPLPDRHPFVVLVVGVNGAGKTTTIGKLAQRLKAEGRSVLLAAGDTFRAAAVEQLSSWGQRLGVPVIAQDQGADSASVIFDAVRSGQARGIDVVVADTAGRLQAKANLMEELAKIKRVMAKLDPLAPHEVVLVLDGGVGQNALSQVREFDAAVGLTGLIVTKLDGTAKAGVLFAIAEQSRLPVYFVGVGEQSEDLRPFEPEIFVDALLGQDRD